MQKGLAPILIVILIALGIFGYLYFQKTKVALPTTAPITNPSSRPSIQPSSTPKAPRPSPDVKLDESGKFKIYTNHIENYTFKFPADWILEESFGEKGSGDPRIDDPEYLYATIYPPSEIKKESQFRNSISVIVTKPNPRRQAQESEENAQKFTKIYNQPLSDGTGQREYKISNTTVSNQPAVRVINRALPGDATETYYSLSTLFRYGIYDYSIGSGSNNEEFINKNIGIYDQIVDSFQLTGPAPAVKPIALKSYRNEKHGYSFQYPSNWLVNGDIMGGQIIVVDENDREMFTLTIEPRYGASCPPDSYYGSDYHTPEADIQFGAQKVHLRQDCNGPWVKTASGQEFRLDGAFFTKQPDQRFLNLLKSIQGLKVVP